MQKSLRAKVGPVACDASRLVHAACQDKRDASKLAVVCARSSAEKHGGGDPQGRLEDLQRLAVRENRR